MRLIDRVRRTPPVGVELDLEHTDHHRFHRWPEALVVETADLLVLLREYHVTLTLGQVDTGLNIQRPEHWRQAVLTTPIKASWLGDLPPRIEQTMRDRSLDLVVALLDGKPHRGVRYVALPNGLGTVTRPSWPGTRPRARQTNALT